MNTQTHLTEQKWKLEIKNCKENRDYDLKSNNEIAKVEQLEIEIGKSMMSSVFWEMWNENHGEIDENEWVNQKKKKNQRRN